MLETITLLQLVPLTLKLLLAEATQVCPGHGSIKCIVLLFACQSFSHGLLFPVT